MSCGQPDWEHAVYVEPDSLNDKCRSCDAPIVWGRTNKDKRAPFDAETLRRKKEQHREDVQLTVPVVVKQMRARLPKEGQMYRATPELDEKGTLWIVA